MALNARHNTQAVRWAGACQARHGLPWIFAAIACAVLSTAASTRCVAGEAGAPPYTLPHTESHQLFSEHVEDDFHIAVALPIGYESAPADRKFPVLFAPDADIGFAMAVQIAQLMQFRKEVPPVVIVGIGYGDLQSGLAKRARDLTPTRAEDHAACKAGRAGCGGAAAFLRFIRTELKPFIASRYRVDIEDNAYFGYSLGGLFGLYVLFHEPGTFSRYAIGSPALGWDQGVTFHYEESYAGSNEDLQARLFLSVGSLDDPGFVSKTEQLAERLSGRNYPGLTLTSKKFEGETHASAPAVTFSRALRVIFQAQETAPPPPGNPDS